MDSDLLTQKFRRLQAIRPLPRAVLENLAAWLRVELTYTSNALEGSTLTRAETALVLEKGMTVNGKPLKDHLEATDHAAAWDWVLTQSRRKPDQISEDNILNIHRLVLQTSEKDWAGQYRRHPVRVAGSTTIFPNPAKVPQLMHEFAKWLHNTRALHPAALAAEAHYRLVTIHPFHDGNGRTARLLMNMVLLQSGYPPAIIAPQQRAAYLRVLEQAQTGGAYDDFEQLIFRAIDASLDIYLKAADDDRNDKTITPKRRADLLRIGQLAKLSGVTIPTLRHWLNIGLILPVTHTESGYQLFDKTTAARIAAIRTLQEKHLPLAEIKQKLE